ncbi:MAG: bifunctional glutamate N-acetyltransferase/amino-acid acetyltransferase ArgJ [Clostridia bacterium]|nr:bifunctional glutamate N-acetyltransferase/amino-acid acetyltransferase ArgJ [Clostridia bacterium]
MKKINGGVSAAKGFKANGVHCGIRKNKDKLDLALITCDVRCAAASVYTKNKVKGAPLTVTKQNLSDGMAQAIICNSGNANTCNADGIEKATAMCDLVQAHTKINSGDVIVASTGVIGEPLNMQPIQDGMKSLVDGLSYDGSSYAAQAIMTTDRVQKEIAYSFELDGKECRIGGIAKGSGMINPNMATLLCFMTTDVDISSEMLNVALGKVVKDTLNMVCIDGDTSTNDMLSIMSSGLAGNDKITQKGSQFNTFCKCLQKALTYLAKEIAKDGEGATKLLECKVVKAKNTKCAKSIASSVVSSSLVKAAMFASDANWGRILCAIGYTQEQFDVSKIDVDLKSTAGTVRVCENGAGVKFDEEIATKVLSQNEVCILVDCNDGNSKATAWGCDLTYDYVRINADYRT